MALSSWRLPNAPTDLWWSTWLSRFQRRAALLFQWSVPLPHWRVHRQISTLWWCAWLPGRCRRDQSKRQLYVPAKCIPLFITWVMPSRCFFKKQVNYSESGRNEVTKRSSLKTCATAALIVQMVQMSVRALPWAKSCLSKPISTGKRKLTFMYPALD